MENATDKVGRIYDKHKNKIEGSFHDVLWQILVNGVRKANLESAFTHLYPSNNGCEVGIADKGRKGYTPTSIFFKADVPVKERVAIVDDLNREVFGLEPDQALMIVIDTMRN